MEKELEINQDPEQVKSSEHLFPKNGSVQVQQERNNQRRRARFECLYSVPFLFTLLAVVACVISITVTGITMSSGTRKGKTNQRKQQTWSIEKNVCIPCYLIGNQLELKPLVDQLEKTKKDGTEMYCACDSIGMSALLKLVLKQKAIEPANDKHEFVMAHRRLYHRKNESDKGALGITKQVNGTEKLKGVAIEEDAFVILNTGIYFVYANVFLSVKSEMEPKRKVVLGNISHRRGAGQHRTLVKLVHTTHACENCVDDLQTAYGAGMFKLHRGDSLQIVMSDRDEVKFDGKSSYAGVVMFSASN